LTPETLNPLSSSSDTVVRACRTPLVLIDCTAYLGNFSATQNKVHVLSVHVCSHCVTVVVHNAGEEELRMNPRSRSAKLRIVEML